MGTSAEKGSFSLLILNLQKHQPAIIPAADAVWVADDEPFRLVQALRGEGVVLSEASELAEEIVGVDIVGPGGGHWFCDFCGVEVREYFLNSAKFCDGVDTVCSQGVNELILVILHYMLVLDLGKTRSD
jgi:hypothetical protein